MSKAISASILAGWLVVFSAGAQARQAAGPGGLGGGGPVPDVTDGPTAAERELADQVLRMPANPGASRVLVPDRFTFFPMGGQLYRDLFTNNFVDLAPGPGLLDWDCTDFTYDGHDASDVELRCFGEQDIGVPVFSVLDGVVVAAHDGEDDMHTSCSGTANSVIIDHGGGRRCSYWHLRRNSVQVGVGQVVKAGQQIGLTGSSGCSTWPHLHFAVYDSGQLVEPYTGPCNSGLSQWIDQTPIERNTYVGDLNLTNVDISTLPGLPFDIPRRGTFVSGMRTVRFWIKLMNLPAASDWRVVFLRPDASVALNSGTQSFSGGPYRNSWWWWSYSLNLNVTGTWKVRLLVNGTNLAEAPFDVVASAAEVVNRPPDPVAATLWPPEPTTADVLQCRLQADLIIDDPDYDIVRYRYHWKVNGLTVRDVVSAATSDTFPRGTAPAGSLVTCRVTPGDGTLEGPSTLTANVIRPFDHRRAASAPTTSVTRQH